MLISLVFMTWCQVMLLSVVLTTLTFEVAGSTLDKCSRNLFKCSSPDLAVILCIYLSDLACHAVL